MDPLKEIEGLVSNKLSAFKTILSIFKLEARLARLSIFPLIVNIALLLIVLLTTGASLMLLTGYFAVLVFHSYLAALIFILVLNVGLLTFLLFYLSFNLKNMSFEKTRKHILSHENE